MDFLAKYYQSMTPAQKEALFKAGKRLATAVVFGILGWAAPSLFGGASGFVRYSFNGLPCHTKREGAGLVFVNEGGDVAYGQCDATGLYRLVPHGSGWETGITARVLGNGNIRFALANGADRGT